ncbi:MAG: hypothetical protein JWN56_2447 [Sphingobacteriales bacterium]|nr:hypothetical protein [Sphingobacteriales bacterium]
MNTNTDWKLSNANVFWGEIAPCDHVLQIYEDDESFLDVLQGFVGDGINAKEGVIVIATQQHLHGLETRLIAHGINVKSLIDNGDYIPLDAAITLSRFMVNGWPDEELFFKVVTDLIVKAKKDNRKVRAFGEMVAILWAQGNNGATVNLEHLWNKFCEREAFCLFCAYPKSGFTQSQNESLLHICNSHSRLIKPSQKPANLFYQDVHSKKHN